MANQNKTAGLKEVLLFVSFICLIFAFIVSNEITSSDLFLKILNIVLLVALTGIGFISAIKCLINSVNEHSTPMIYITSAVLLIYVTLIIKICYTV